MTNFEKNVFRVLQIRFSTCKNLVDPRYRASMALIPIVLSSSNRGRLLVQELGHIHSCIFDLMKTKQIQERNTRGTKYAKAGNFKLVEYMKN